MKSLKFFVAMAAAGLLVGGLVLYTAQAQNESRQGFRGGAVIHRIIKRLNLTPDQIKQVKEALRSEKEKVAPLLTDLQAARKELRETINRPGVDETDVRAAAAKVAVIETDLAVERAKISAKIRPILTDEQIQKIKTFQARADDFAVEALRRFGQLLEKQ